MLDIAERRWLAALVDVITVLLAAMCSFGLTYRMANTQTGGDQVMVFGYVAVAAIPALYSLVELVFNASPGKFATRLRITDKTGERPRRSQSIARWLLKMLPPYVSTLCMFVAVPWPMTQTLAAVIVAIAAGAVIADYLSLLSDPPTKTLHDRLTGTEVRVKNLPEPHGFPVADVRDTSP